MINRFFNFLQAIATWLETHTTWLPAPIHAWLSGATDPTLDAIERFAKRLGWKGDRDADG